MFPTAANSPGNNILMGEDWSHIEAEQRILKGGQFMTIKNPDHVKTEKYINLI